MSETVIYGQPNRPDGLCLDTNKAKLAIRQEDSNYICNVGYGPGFVIHNMKEN